MKLATRISLFFLIAIAAVLVGFAGSIYGIVRAHLYRQLDDAAVAALDTLAASIEFTSDGLEWEPAERKLTFGTTGSNTKLIWALLDGDGRYIDGTTDGASILTAFEYAGPQSFVERGDAKWNGEQWRISRRALQSDAKKASPMDEKDSKPKRYSRLYLAVGLSLESVKAQLRDLALTLVGISIAVWLIAALLGEWLCRNALRR